MRDRLLVESIKIDRTPDPGRNPLPLAEDIRDNGQHNPILVTPDYELIDGLKRIQAIQALGYITVDAVITNDFEEAIANLVDAHDRETSTPARVWEIEQWLIPMAAERTTRMRRRATVDKMREPAVSSRTFWMAGLGKDAEIVKRLYTYAADGDELAQYLVERVNRGEMTPIGARHLLDMRSFSESRSGGEEYSSVGQEHLLSTSAMQFGAMIKGLEKLGTPVVVSKDKLDPLLAQFRKGRGALTTIINKIERNRLTK